jgi:hypothetical protein
MGEMTAGSTAGSEVTTGAASTEKRVEKVADAFVFAFVVTVQLLAMPLHAPPQPKKPQLAAGLAFRVT